MKPSLEIILFYLAAMELLCCCLPALADPCSSEAGGGVSYFRGGGQQLKPCPSESGSFLRILLATVPRSGTTYTLNMLREATGLATGTVYEEPNTVWDDRSQSYQQLCVREGWCGVENNMTSRPVRVPTGHEPSIVKTHFPFQWPEVLDTDCFSAVLMPVRHPFDNYIAFLSWVEEQVAYTWNATDEPKGKILHFRIEQPFERFAKLWSLHHAYWRAEARTRGVPLLEYRYEDLCSQPEKVMEEVLRFTGYKARSPSFETKWRGDACWLRHLWDAPWVEGIVTRAEVKHVLAQYESQLKYYGYCNELLKEWLEQVD